MYRKPSANLGAFVVDRAEAGAGIQELAVVIGLRVQLKKPRPFAVATRDALFLEALERFFWGFVFLGQSQTDEVGESDFEDHRAAVGVAT